MPKLTEGNKQPTLGGFLDEVTLGEREFGDSKEGVLGGMDKVIIDGKAGGNGVVPYMNLQELTRKKTEGGQ